MRKLFALLAVCGLAGFLGCGAEVETTTDDVPPVTEETTPEMTTPEVTTPEEATPEEATPEEATPEEATPEEATPEEGDTPDENP